MSAVSHIGIDFGTTNTVVVEIYKDEFGQKIRNLGEDGNYPFSSIVAIPKNDNTEILFGRSVRAKQQELSETHDIFLSMKSYLGTDKEFVLGDKRFTATDITTKFLEYVKNYIKETHDLEITSATFSLPVGFTANARRELKKASIQAKITPNGFISESTSAYIANINENKDLSKVMVIDWGGGTLDISILDVTKDKLVESTVWGEKIGGDDIDLEMANLVHKEIMKTNDKKVPLEEMTPAQRDNLIMLCEKAKIEFSVYDDDYPLTVKNYGIYGTKTIDISYDFFREIAKKIIIKKVIPNIDIALDRGNITNDDIDAVIIVGGSSEIKPFATAITNIFGKNKIIIPKNTQWSVAIGAALTNVTGSSIRLNSTLGILMSDDSIYPILKKSEHGIGSKIDPLTFALTEDSQEAKFIFVDENGNPYQKENIPTKGFLKEKLILTAEITDVQIAKITIKSESVSSIYEKEIEINKLMFYYDLENNLENNLDR